MKSTLAIPTRIGVAILISLTLVTAAVTAFVVTNPKSALSRVTAPAPSSSTPAPSTTPGSQPADSAALVYAKSTFAGADSSAENEAREIALENLLPNHLYSFDGEPPAPLAAGIVIGEVTGAVGAFALDSASGARVEFDVTDAVSARVIDLDIAVQTGLGEASGRSNVAVRVRIDGDIDPALILAGVVEFPRVIIVLDSTDSDDLFQSRRGTVLVGFVDDLGTITFPALHETESAFIGSLTTIRLLEDEAARAAVVGKTADGRVVAT